MTNDNEIIQEQMENHDKHYWALVQGLKRKRKGWGELADMIGEGSTVARAIWDKYVDFDFTKPATLGAAVSASPQPRLSEVIERLNLLGQSLVAMDDLDPSDPMADALETAQCNLGAAIELLKKFAQFFAAAPAQEPDSDLLARYNRAYSILGEALNLNAEFYGLAEMAQVAANRLTGKYDSAAQEKPVDNSPQEG